MDIQNEMSGQCDDGVGTFGCGVKMRMLNVSFSQDSGQKERA